MNPTQKDYDVIILGAGPAGLSCAAELGRSDLSILIVDQKEVIGPKICAGGLTRRDLNYLHLPDELLDRRFKEMSIRTPFASTTVKDEYDLICTIDREEFANWQLEKLSDFRNIEICKGCKVTGITKDEIVLESGSCVRYRYLVGADGSFSAVRRFLGIETKDTAIAIQYIIPTDKYDKLEFFLDSELFSTWYAWIFPHKGYSSIGCMCDPRQLSAKKLQQSFTTWLKRNKIDISKGRYEGYAINYDYRGYKFGNVYLAGDAAGLASGLTGEGIYQAIISGEDVAKTILDEKYEAVGIEELLHTKSLHAKAMNSVIKMGPLRNLFFALLVPAIKNRKLADRIIKYVG